MDSPAVEVKKVTLPRTIGPDGPTPEQATQIATFRQVVRKLVPALEGDLSLMESLLVRKGVVESEPTNAPTYAGQKGLPFNYDAAIRLTLHNVHHSACVNTKKMSLVGLGHTSDKARKALDPICTLTWPVLEMKLAEDFAILGICYIECVRDVASDKIIGLHHVPAVDVRIVVENDLINYYYEIRGGKIEALAASANTTVMAPFGQLKAFTQRHAGKINGRPISEIIAIMDPSSQSRYYAVPSWLASVADMELNQAVRQHVYDFHVNRGVPEFLLFLTGGRVDTKTWAAIVEAMQAYVGVGNSHKSSAFNVIGEDIEVNLQQLESNDVIKGDFYRVMTEALSTTIVSAHRVPPILAGILIPGKMGAANELPNAIMAFQTLVIGPWQTIWQSILGATLGNEKFNGGLGLTDADFEFKSIVDAMAEGLAKLNPNPGAGGAQANTISGMRQTLPEAAAQGRDVGAGLKKRERLIEFLADLL
jgi:hypothetical protein